jgi:hypothetical protein
MNVPIIADLRFDLLRAAKYHADRAAFLKTVNALALGIIILFGTGVGQKFAGQLGVNALWLELPAIGLGTLQMIGRWEISAAHHVASARSCYEFLAEIEAGRLSDKEYRILCSKFIVRAETKTTMRAADALAHNLAVDALAPNEHDRLRFKREMKWYHIVFRHLFVFHNANFPFCAGV